MITSHALINVLHTVALHIVVGYFPEDKESLLLEILMKTVLQIWLSNMIFAWEELKDRFADFNVKKDKLDWNKNGSIKK